MKDRELYTNIDSDTVIISRVVYDNMKKALRESEDTYDRELKKVAEMKEELESGKVVLKTEIELRFIEDELGHITPEWGYVSRDVSYKFLSKTDAIEKAVEKTKEKTLMEEQQRILSKLEILSVRDFRRMKRRETLGRIFK